MFGKSKKKEGLASSDTEPVFLRGDVCEWSVSSGLASGFLGRAAAWVSPRGRIWGTVAETTATHMAQIQRDHLGKNVDLSAGNPQGLRQ